MRDQAQIAIDTADVIIFLVDVRQGLTDADGKVADMLRRSQKPVVLCVNKVDTFKKMEKNDEISEDDLKDAEERIQKITDKAIEKIDKAVENKTKEILTV